MNCYEPTVCLQRYVVTDLEFNIPDSIFLGAVPFALQDGGSG